MMFRDKDRATDAGQTNARSGFSGYHSKDRKRISTPKVTEDRVLSKILQKWKIFQEVIKETDNPLDILCDSTSVAFFLAKKLLNSDITQHRLNEFCVALSDIGYGDPKSHRLMVGLFLSAMTERGRNKSYLIPANLFNIELDYLGFRDTKKLVISGNVRGIGREMIDGEIKLLGSVTDDIGAHMEGGIIIVKGDIDISDTRLIDIGFGGDMEDGEIHIDGKIIGDGQDELWERIESEVHHGKIFYQGKLMVDK